MSPANAATPIYEGQDFYVPYFEIKIQKRPPGQDVIRDILSVSYKDSISEFDGFDITINNWDAETLTFKYSDEKLFDPGQDIEVWMGYYGNSRLRLMLKGTITSLRPSFPAGGGSTLTISGLNTLYKLKTQQESHVYENKTDSDVAREIAGRLGIAVSADNADETPLNYLIQDNQYDIVFLMERARRIGYDLFIDESSGTSVLTFKRSTNVRRLTYQLGYRRTLIEFQPELTTNDQVGKVTVRGWDVVEKKKIEYTATRSEIVTKGVGDKGGQGAIDQSFKDKAEIVATKPVESLAEAKELAKQILEGIAKDMVKGHGSIVGVPDIRAGVVLQLDGLGDRFSGRYFITATTHTIADSGYTTSFEARREEL